MNVAIQEFDEISVNSAIAVQEIGATTSTTSVAFDFEIQANSTNVNVEVQANQSDQFVQVMNYLDTEMWTAEKSQRFRELALKESLEELPIEELAELEKLTRLRRSVQNPRKAAEILWERRQNRVTNELVRALQNYVEFHEDTRHA